VIYKIDENTRQSGHLPDPFPNGYAQVLLSSLVQNQNSLSEIVLALKKHNQERNLWTSTFPWVGVTLEKLLNMGYRMSVISNADGRVEQILKELNLHHYFERIFDSTIVGVGKPDKEFFEIALSELNIKPSKSIYIGDTYFFDVWGANSAGIGCIQLDPLDLYNDWPGTRIPAIVHLPEWLINYKENLIHDDLHPAKDTDLTFEHQTTK
jgi:putative hydrolase of the HAD superfamily